MNTHSSSFPHPPNGKPNRQEGETPRLVSNNPPTTLLRAAQAAGYSTSHSTCAPARLALIAFSARSCLR